MTHRISSSETPPLIASSSTTEPATEARPKAIVSILPATTSVAARAVCICFCAMRPAKSLSKNVTAWPMVQRCRRDRISGNRLGSMVSDNAEVFRPKIKGRATR